MAKSGGGKSRRSGGSGGISTIGDIENANLAQRSDFTEDELVTLQMYQGSLFNAVNSSLRDNIYNATVDEFRPQLDSAMDKSVTSIPLTVMRGVSAKNANQERFIDSLRPGTTFKEAGFMSTTINPEIAQRDFANDGGLGRKSAVITVRVPRGTNAVFMPSALPGTFLSGEQELLLRRGLRYRVISRTDNGNQANIVIEVLP